MGKIYTVLSQNIENQIITTKITINANHPIFKGHFPEQPVLPGVCQLDIITEILSEYLQKDITISQSRNIKYPGMIIPGKIDELTVEIVQNNDDGTEITSRIFSDDSVFLKAKIKFSII